MTTEHAPEGHSYKMIIEDGTDLSTWTESTIDETSKESSTVVYAYVKYVSI